MKKLLMIAVAVPLAAPALASDNEAKIGGRIFTSIEHERNGKGQSATDISDNNSRIWIMGSEKLDKDLKLIYGVNSFVAFDYNGWSTDDSYIGLRGDFGTVRAGWLSTPMHYLTGEQDAFNGNNHTQTMGRMTRFGGREIALNYESKTFDNGFNYRVQIAPGANKYKDRKRNGDWMAGLGLHYKHPTNGFNAHYALEYARNGSPDDTKDRQVHSLKVGYDKDDLYLAAGMMYARNVADKFHWEDETKTNTNTRDFQVTAGYTMGNITPKLGVAYGRSDTGKNYKQLAFNTEYKFSKRTTPSFNSGVVKESKDPKTGWAAGVSLEHSLQ